MGSLVPTLILIVVTCCCSPQHHFTTIAYNTSPVVVASTTSRSRIATYNSISHSRSTSITNGRLFRRRSLVTPSQLFLHTHQKEETTNNADIGKKKGTTLSSTTISIPWLIVGGGIHGVHIAARLLESGKIGEGGGGGKASEENLCIVDNNPYLLQKWKSRTANTGMKYLRSSSGYHLDIDENSLRRHYNGNGGKIFGAVGSKKRKRRKKVSFSSSGGGGSGVQKNGATSDGSVFFTNDYERPRLDIFNQHCNSVIEKYQLDQLHQQGLVTAIKPNDDYVQVEVSLPNGEHIKYNAKNIVLAMGNDEPSYVEWVNKEDIENGLVHHLLDDEKYNIRQSENDNNSETVSDPKDRNTYNVAVIGGGITAAHKALELAHLAKTKYSHCSTNVHLISRHPLKEQQFDTHQDWMMDRAAANRSLEKGGSGIPKRQRMFSKSTCWKERRQIIAKERIPGTVTPAVNRGDKGLRYAIQNNDIRFHQAEVLKKKSFQKHKDNHLSKDSQFCMELSLSSGEVIEVDKVFLATGFGKKLPGGKVIMKDLVEKAGLEVSNFCGFPIVDENLSWHPRIFVSGALAELELGPSARNIAGARLAAERILHVKAH